MTQVQFGEELGITGNSVYRYEAGLSPPDIETLDRLWVTAVSHENKSAEAAFLHALRERFATPVRGAPDSGFHVEEMEWPIRGLQANAKWLGEEENLMLLALSNMLRGNLDKTAEAVIKTVLKPWMEEARTVRQNALKEATPKPPLNRNRRS